MTNSQIRKSVAFVVALWAVGQILLASLPAKAAYPEQEAQCLYTQLQTLPLEPAACAETSPMQCKSCIKQFQTTCMTRASQCGMQRATALGYCAVYAPDVFCF